MEGYATYEHYFLISTRVALVLSGWLYFGFFLQLNFQFAPPPQKKGKERHNEFLDNHILIWKQQSI